MPVLVPLQSCPRQQRLSELYRRNADLVAALAGIAALHRGEGEVTLRGRWTERGARAAPHPDDLESLLWVLLRRVLLLLGRCEGPRDDLLVAAFLMDGLAELQPFDVANARIALDLGLYVLMQRWGLERAPLVFDASADRVLDAVFRFEDEPPGTDAHARYTRVTTLSCRFAGAELSGLRCDPAYGALADWLTEAMGLGSPG